MLVGQNFYCCPKDTMQKSGLNANGSNLPVLLMKSSHTSRHNGFY